MVLSRESRKRKKPKYLEKNENQICFKLGLLDRVDSTLGRSTTIILEEDQWKEFYL